MDKEINTVSEEQVLHNKLSFEINQELIHLMKRIVELQQQNQKYKEVIDKLIEYLQEKYDSSGLCGIVLNFTEFEDIKDLLKEVE